MKKNKVLLYLMIIASIILCIPSILYLVNNKTVDGFDSYYTYTLNGYYGNCKGILDGIIIIGLLLIFSIIYLMIVKKEKEIFKNKKQIILFILIIAFIFMMILPFLSSDIYYYIGDSWLASKYGENPYYTSVKDLQDNGINDEILNNTGYWKNTTSVYGPIWNSIAKLLVSLSFGKVTIALFVFKIASLLIHVLNSYLMYKITKSNKYMLLYGLNPLVLVELLSNVHNDIYLILFILLALYFLIRKKNIYFTVIFLALSICVKYSTVLIVPFILLYYFKDKSIPKRILYCMIAGISILVIVILFYLPYYQDMSIFTNMLVQGDRYSQSIVLLLMQRLNNKIFLLIDSIRLPVFAIIYVSLLINILFKRQHSIKELFNKYNVVMIVFIFCVLTNFQKWYILWLLPTIIWQNKNMRNFILSLTITAIVPSFKYFEMGNDAFIYGIYYSATIILLSIIIVIIENLLNQIKRRIKCQD